MTVRIAALALVAALGATATVATVATAQTLGDRVDSGRLSEVAFSQLIQSTGLTPQEARGLTLDEIVAIRWQDD